MQLQLKTSKYWCVPLQRRIISSEPETHGEALPFSATAFNLLSQHMQESYSANSPEQTENNGHVGRIINLQSFSSSQRAIAGKRYVWVWAFRHASPPSPAHATCPRHVIHPFFSSFELNTGPEDSMWWRKWWRCQRSTRRPRPRQLTALLLTVDADWVHFR